MRNSVVALSLLCLGAGISPGFAVEEVNRIVLRINERIVTLADYEKAKRERLAALSRAEIPEARRQELMATAGEDTLRDLYEEMLVLSRADQLGVEIPASAVREEIEQTKKNFGIETEEDFEKALAQSNMTREELRAQIEKGMMVREVFGREVNPRVNVEEEDLRRYYRSHPEQFEEPRRLKLREVVILDSSGESEDERNRIASRLRADLLAPAPAHPESAS